MGCVQVPWGDGSVIFCGRNLGKSVPCFSASDGKHRAAVECDFPVGEGKTCDRNCCKAHSKRIGPDKDLCLEHWVQMGKPAYVP